MGNKISPSLILPLLWRGRRRGIKNPSLQRRGRKRK